MSEKFIPTFFMKNKHIQTLYSSFFRKTKIPKLKVEKFILNDGDFLHAHWHYTANSNTNTPIVILFHGLTGSYKSPYIRGIMHQLSLAGFNSVLMHFRGCSGEINNLPRSYHSGETTDARSFIKSLKERFAHAKLYAVGYSLGGNMLLKLLGETQEDSLLTAAVAVSPPMQLDICADAIKQGFSLIYQEHLMKSLRQSLKEKYKMHNMHSLLNFQKTHIKNLKTFWDFDEVYTAPIHGFGSAQDYYTQCSSKQYLKDIHIKTLIIHSIDDPFMHKDVLPTKEELSQYVELEVSKYGGHVGFIGGTFFKPEYWLDKRVTYFLSKINNQIE